MAKVYKIEIYVTDINGDYNDVNELVDEIENNLNCKCFNIKESKEFEWDDNLPINYINATQSDYDKALNN